MNKVVGYCRFSSDHQREESIDAQIRAIKDFCLKNNYKLIKFYKDEGISGTSIKDRGDFLDLIEASKYREFKYVIVHKFDRFARNRYDHAIFEKKLNDNGVKLISVLEQLNDTPESVILKSVLTGMNEYYSLNLSREVKKGLKENALKGKHNGGKPPLGYDLDENRRYIINDKEAESVKLIFQLALDGVGYGNIAKILNKKNLKNKLGRDFKKVSIRDTLLNVKYIGTYYHGLKDEHGNLNKEPIIIENNHAAIISKDVFYKVQTIFKSNKRGPRTTDKNTYYLTGFCTCGECGSSYSGGYRSKTRNGTIHYGYQCRHRKDKINDCKNKPIRKELLEDTVYSIIKEEVFNERNIRKLETDIYNLIIKKSSNKKIIDDLKKELKQLEESSLKLLDKNLTGKILDSIFDIKNEELKSKILTVKEKIFSTQSIKIMKKEDIRKYILKLKKDSNESLKRNILESFLKDIFIFQNKIEIHIRKFPLDMAKVGGSDGRLN